MVTLLCIGSNSSQASKASTAPSSAPTTESGGESAAESVTDGVDAAPQLSPSEPPSDALPPCVSELSQVFKYTFSKLLKGVSDDTTCAVRVLHVSGRAPAPALVRQALEKFPNVVTTLVPVCRLTEPRTVLSICAIRQQ